MKIYLLIHIIFLSIFSNLLSGQKLDFQLIPSSESGLTFSNDLVANLETTENLFDYDYFYNGAGVGVIDINNDGLQDIYFAANQQENKLYLNLGDFKFKDITKEAFGNFKTQWSTGVSIVDINQDGLLDIYVSQGGPLTSMLRNNLLFINNGDQTFTELATLYGLDDRGMSTQALFIDHDRDGDLDCFVMNESLAYGLDPVAFTRLNLEQKASLYESYSHFYENDNGLFTDSTKELGLDEATFGLGISSCDVNSDGWSDIYIANDYYVPDMLFVNKKGKGFTNQIKLRTKQMSFYGMGMDIADVNNDGSTDIFVLDMASGDHYRSKTLMRSMNVENFRLLVDGLNLPHQYMFNSLQVNNGNGTYNNMSQLAGVSSTDWSWSVLIEDLDFDGYKDIYITNGYRKYALDNDFQQKVRDSKLAYNNETPLNVKKELYEQMPIEKLSNIFYKNKGQLKFEEWELDSKLNPPSFSNGAAIADFDNDGDPDMVVNNLDSEAFLYKNLAVENGQFNFLKIKNTDQKAISIRRVEVYTPSHLLAYEPKTVRGYMSSSEPSVFAGLGEEKSIDSVKVFFSNDKFTTKKDVEINTILSKDDFLDQPALQTVAKRKYTSDKLFREMIPANLGLEYTHEENEFDDFEKEILLPYKQSSIGPFLSKVDVDNDGLDDIIVSNGLGTSIGAYRQNKDGFEPFALPEEFDCSNKEYGKIEIADLNQDGKVDFLLPAGGNEQAQSNAMYESGILMSDIDTTYNYLSLAGKDGSAKGMLTFDFDLDGDQDLLIYKRHTPQKYPMHASSFLYENENGKFKDVTVEVFPALLDFGIINDVQLTDLNNDQRPDLILVGEWTNIGFFENDNYKYKDVHNKYGVPDLKGLWFSVETADLNQDNQPDFIIGNIGQNSKYSASSKKPLKIYGGDFDSNGSWDLVLSKSYKDNYVPLRGLECSSQQMPFIKEKFGTYDLFAKATLEDVYGPSLESAYARYANTLSSYAIISTSKETYDIVKLPLEAQAFPILDMEILDINKDGNEEIILAGNIYDTEVETPRLDAGNGLVLAYKPEQGFTSITSNISGLNLEGDIKSTCLIYHSGLQKYLLVASQNNGQLKVFTILK